MAAGAHVLLRIVGRWRAESPERLSWPVLLLDDGTEVRPVAPLRGDDDAEPVAGPDPALWRAAFAVPAAQLTDGNATYGLATSHGTISLPAPIEASRGPRPRAEAPPPRAPDVQPPRAGHRRADADRGAGEPGQALAALRRRLAAEQERAEQATARLQALERERDALTARADRVRELERQQQRALEALQEADDERERREAAERALERADAARAALAGRVAELEQRAAELSDRAAEAELEAEFALAREREHATALDVVERWPVLVLLLVAVPVGIAAGIQPALAAALLGIAIVAALVVVAPVVHFALLIAVTAIVPYDVQQALEFGAGGAGLQLADLLLFTGLARAAVVLARRPPGGLTAVVGGLMVVFMGIVLVQGIHGWTAGHTVSQVAYETREVFTWATLLIAIPLLMDPRRRSQLLTATMVIGLLVGLWGIAQWVLDIPFGEAGDAGVQAGVALTSAGRGQVQGALFAFPVAVLVGLAVLVSGGARSPRTRALLAAIVVINALSLLLTFERSLWVATVAGALFIVLRSSAVSRFKAIITMALVVLLALPVLATIAPGALTTARERLLSIGQYGSDNSVRFRIDESRFVLDRITDHPITGSGMGATIHWGRPYDRVAASSTPFSHNSVLWLSWKLGIPAVILLLAMIACAFVPRRYGENATNTAVRHGAQAALVAMLIISVTFQSLASRPITPTLGLVLALCVVGTGAGAVRARARTPSAEPLAYAT